MNRSTAACLLLVLLCACETQPEEAVNPSHPESPVTVTSPAAAPITPVTSVAEVVAEPAKNVVEETTAEEPRDGVTPLAADAEPAVVADIKAVLPEGGERSGELVRTGKASVGAMGLGGLGLKGSGRGGGGSVGYSSYGRGILVGQGSAVTVGGRPHVESGFNTESYAHYKANGFVDPATDRLSTFSIDVDTGSYTIARRKLNEGALPARDAVRVEEFVNYFKYGYSAPTTSPIAVHLEAAPSPFSADPNTKVLRVGVQAQKVDNAGRQPVHLTFLVDVSGSMSSGDKLGLAKRSLGYLVDNLREQDTVAIATYAGRVAEILKPTTAGQRETILAAIDNLQSGGSTAMDDGLNLAYELASRSVAPGQVSRVIVVSDGDANVGSTGHDDILRRIESHVAKGVTLSTIGVGMGNYKDTMMEQLANKGNGNYYYFDDFKEAQRIFGEQLDGTLQVVAKDVKIQVEFDPALVTSYRLIGYENRDIADRDFRNDKVDAGEMGVGHSVTALYEVVLKHAEPTSFATVRVRHKLPEAAAASELRFSVTAEKIRGSVGQASGDFQFAVAVAGFAEILRRSTYADDLSYDLILEVAGPHIGKDARRKEFIALVEKARGLDTSARSN